MLAREELIADHDRIMTKALKLDGDEDKARPRFPRCSLAPRTATPFATAIETLSFSDMDLLLGPFDWLSLKAN